MRKCIVQHVIESDGSQGWRCGKYLMSRGVTFKMTSDHCYHFQCPGRLNPLPPCKARECTQHVPNLESPYCSEKCEESEESDTMVQAPASIRFKRIICKRQSCRKNVYFPRRKFCSRKCCSRSSSKTYRDKRRTELCSTQK